MGHEHHQKKKVNFQNLPIVGNQPRSEKEEKFLREVKKYEFLNIEEPGVSHRFPYGNSKHNHNFTMFHGGKYDLPRFIARHLESCKTPIWKWRPDGLGGMQKENIGSTARFQMREVFE